MRRSTHVATICASPLLSASGNGAIHDPDTLSNAGVHAVCGSLYSGCASTHFVQFFDVDSDLTDSVARFAREAFKTDATCLVIGTSEHRKAVQQSLAAAGLAVDELVASYQYISLDAYRTLSGFMVNDRVDRERLHSVMDLLIRQAGSRGQQVWIFGEMVALLAARGLIAAALQLEELWNELSREHDFTLFCACMESDIQYDAAVRKRIASIHSYEASMGAG
jgi:hypothetical protein